MAAKSVIPARCRRSKAPAHRDTSGFTGFFTITGTPVPARASANSCTAKGLTVVRAPIQSTSMPWRKASSTWRGVATSIAVGMPVSAFTRCNQGNATAPMPSKEPGRVRGFQMPARNKSIFPSASKAWAVASTCSSVSAEQGPAMRIGCPFWASKRVKYVSVTGDIAVVSK